LNDKGSLKFSYVLIKKLWMGSWFIFFKRHFVVGEVKLIIGDTIFCC
jgi:hypothetical protein